MDFWQLIMADQANLRELTREIAGALGDGAKSRDRLFRDLHQELERHLTAKEWVLYPALQCDERTRTELAGLENEHQGLREHLDELSRLPHKNSREWTRRFDAFKAALERHFSRMEHGLVPVTRGVFDRETLDKLRAAFEREKIAALRAAKWGVPTAVMRHRWGLATGASVGALAGLVGLAVALAAWRTASARRRRQPFVRRQIPDRRTESERRAASMM